MVHSILDSAYVCHIAFVDGGAPQIIPMSYWRAGEFIYFHSGARGRFARACREESVAISVTVMDGLVLGHSPINHSMNYRSVVVHGRPEAIDERQAKATAMHYRSIATASSGEVGLLKVLVHKRTVTHDDDVACDYVGCAVVGAGLVWLLVARAHILQIGYKGWPPQSWSM